MKKYIKSCIAFMASVIMLMNTVAMGMTFSDVNDTTPYQDSIKTLTTIGLIKGYEDGSFRPNNNITRAEFAIIVVRALGMENKYSMEQSIPFDDLLGHYARFQVKTAYDLGIINGFEDGNFRPEENVTYEQAMKMVVCMLGYGENAMASGGYPDGYLTVGRQLGLTKGITTLNEAPATRGVIARLIDNSLTVKMQKLALSLTGVKKYEVTEETILKDVLKIERTKVMVTGVGDSVVEEGDLKLKSYEMRVTRVKDNKELILDFSNIYKDHNEPKAYLGHIIVNDEIKDEAEDALKELKDKSMASIANLEKKDNSKYQEYKIEKLQDYTNKQTFDSAFVGQKLSEVEKQDNSIRLEKTNVQMNDNPIKQGNNQNNSNEMIDDEWEITFEVRDN